MLQFPLLVLNRTSRYCLKEVHCHSSVPPAEGVKICTKISLLQISDGLYDDDVRCYDPVNLFCTTIQKPYKEISGSNVKDTLKQYPHEYSHS